MIFCSLTLWLEINCGEHLDVAVHSTILPPLNLLSLGSNWVAHYRARVHLD